MFGYINVYKPELKIREFSKYRAYYCGLCKTLKEKYGRFGQMTLSYDMTFLIILLTSLYESETVKGEDRCIAHPVQKHETLRNEITEYVADMNIALTYYKLLDDWEDEKSLLGLAGAKALKREYQKVCKKYPRQCNAIEKSLKSLLESEKREETGIDLVSRSFGELMAELFVYKEDMWQEGLRKMGFFLGKFIYILDAYDDVEKDIKHGSYNPLKKAYEKESFPEDSKNILTMMMAECTREFEFLPCIEDVEILRNILYIGVWVKFDTITMERQKKKDEKILKEGIEE